MTLEEIFSSYEDQTKSFHRKSRSHFTADIAYLKQMKGWARPESRKMGYFIPQFMIDDANADDWEEAK